MQTQVMKKIDFTGKDLFVGLDVHKKSWSVTIVVDGMEHRTFTQPPDPEALQKYLLRSFPGGNYQSAYEAGYCGYGIHRRLNDLGIKNIVINAADIPTTQKDKLHKRDPVDSRKLARGLEKNSLRGIHVFERDHEELRSLNRTCLLYTSDAADDLPCVDLGGPRLIKKKKNQHTTLLPPSLLTPIHPTTQPH